jgi:hypothetical protein
MDAKIIPLRRQYVNSAPTDAEIMRRVRVRTTDSYFGSDQYAHVLRLEDHETSDDEFYELVECAWEGNLSENDEEFLLDITEKNDKWGAQMFFSEAQSRYLHMLAVRGGWQP